MSNDLDAKKMLMGGGSCLCQVIQKSQNALIVKQMNL